MSDHPSVAALSRFLEGELNTREQALLERHLRDCERCQLEFDALCHLLREAEQPPPRWEGRDLAWERIEDRLRHLPRRGSSYAKRIIGSAFLVAAGIAALLIVGERSPRPTAPPQLGEVVVQTQERLGGAAESPRDVPDAVWDAYRAVDQELARGIERLRLALEEDPGDAPALVELLQRAIDQRQSLAMEFRS